MINDADDSGDFRRSSAGFARAALRDWSCFDDASALANAAISWEHLCKAAIKNSAFANLKNVTGQIALNEAMKLVPKLTEYSSELNALRHRRNAAVHEGYRQLDGALELLRTWVAATHSLLGVLGISELNFFQEQIILETAFKAQRDERESAIAQVALEKARARAEEYEQLSATEQYARIEIAENVAHWHSFKNYPTALCPVCGYTGVVLDGQEEFVWVPAEVGTDVDPIQGYLYLDLNIESFRCLQCQLELDGPAQLRAARQDLSCEIREATADEYEGFFSENKGKVYGSVG